ncbi:HNH endonuclease [Pasteurellaceae bacterium Pebbles2]|nr:HNH endonuclease [Pasteurellaceae bacterium Pebbles2]
MQIELTHIKIRDLYNGYEDTAENGVKGFGGKLDIRPQYQREFVYKEKQRNAVIDTVMKGFPLNVMYWVKREDGSFEVLDGQQRTISICQFVKGDFSVDYHYFHNLPDDKKTQILDYKLTVYQCTGSDSEKLEWFKTINIAGEKLTDQELRNAVYAGSWLSDAKRKFSKTGCVASSLGDKYVKGSPIRQELLETTLTWIFPTETDKEGNPHKSIESYMALHQHDEHATKLWSYFESVINWVKNTFPTYRKEMKGLEWGLFYNQFKETDLNPTALESEIKCLMEDDEVSKKSGIYAYILTRDERHLNLRAFTEKDKRTMFERQNGVCPSCSKTFEISEMEADHITPWSQGGKTDLANGQMLCCSCNRIKSDR